MIKPTIWIRVPTTEIQLVRGLTNSGFEDMSLTSSNSAVPIEDMGLTSSNNALVRGNVTHVL